MEVVRIVEIKVLNSKLKVIFNDGFEEEFVCAIGENGLVSESNKREGDMSTPIGSYNLLELYYRKDKVGEVVCGLPKRIITKKCGWSDDSNMSYNKYVKLPFGGSFEKLWRDDDAYDLVIITSHNSFPSIPDKGSAIFFHVAKYNNNGSIKSTEGCVAIDKNDMLRILPYITSDTKINILYK
ncbi:MAG: L,D-transpeptidase family protein [Alphaproteobacteria bacterium]|nr:L,D-transpeptidase family protein [Alphaproteobacteria bacterium]